MGSNPFFAELEFILDWLANGASRSTATTTMMTRARAVADDRSSFHFRCGGGRWRRRRRALTSGGRFFAGGQFSATLLSYKVRRRPPLAAVVAQQRCAAALVSACARVLAACHCWRVRESRSQVQRRWRSRCGGGGGSGGVAAVGGAEFACAQRPSGVRASSGWSVGERRASAGVTSRRPGWSLLSVRRSHSLLG